MRRSLQRLLQQSRAAPIDEDFDGDLELTTLCLFLESDNEKENVRVFINGVLAKGLITLAPGWFWRFSAKKTPKRTWLCG